MHFATFEEVEVGATASYGSYEMTEDEIVEFAGQYDPQPFHTDPEAARESMFGGLVASGWHTAAVTIRLLVDGVFSRSGALGAVGVDELRWPTPVRPGDALSVGTEVLGTEADYRPGVGLVRARVETTNGDGDVVQSMVGRVLYPHGE
jgi:acyl dehydratase